MKSFIFLVLTISFFHTLPAIASDESDANFAWLEKARGEALNILDAAYKASGEDKFLSLKDALSSANFSDSDPIGKCNGGKTDAYVIPIFDQNTIHICQALYEDYYILSDVEQVLIHESAHVSGIYDECEADAVAASAFRAAGLQPGPGGYDNTCLNK